MTLTVIENETRSSTATAFAVPVYVSGENVPATDKTRAVARPTVRGMDDALMALREWERASHEAKIARLGDRLDDGLVDGFIARIGAGVQVWMHNDVAEGDASPDTLRSYLVDIRQHLEWLKMDGICPAEAGIEEAKRYRKFLVDVHATSTVGRKLAGTRGFYAMAMARGAIYQNPFFGLKSPSDKTERYERIQYLNDDERRKLFAVVPTTPIGKRDKAMIVLMMNHSLRVSEVCGLEMSDVDLTAGKNGAVRVRGKGRRSTSESGEIDAREFGAKGGKDRTIYLTQKTKGIIMEWLEIRRLMKVKDESLFMSMHFSSNNTSKRQPGEGITPRGVRKGVDRYMELAGIKKAGRSCHALRHTFFTESVRRGADLTVTSRTGGHSSIDTTMVYVDLVKMEEMNPAERLDDMIGYEDPTFARTPRRKRKK